MHETDTTSTPVQTDKEKDSEENSGLPDSLEKHTDLKTREVKGDEGDTPKQSGPEEDEDELFQLMFGDTSHTERSGNQRPIAIAEDEVDEIALTVREKGSDENEEPGG